MKFIACVGILSLLITATSASAQEENVAPPVTSAPARTVVVTPQVITPGEAVVTTVAQPDGKITTTTTQMVTQTAPSMTAYTKNGNKMELDSDGSVYKVFDDGSRVAAEDGVHQLSDGTIVTVKDGKRIP